MIFLSERDSTFFQGINNEIINNVIETSINIFKLVIGNHGDSEDIYGENVDKFYKTGVIINCLILREDLNTTTSTFGTNTTQFAKFAINRNQIKEKNIYPEVGDICEWNGLFFEINNVNENQYIMGRPEYNHSIIINAHSTNVSNTNLGERNQ
jgi:hypothetical protein